MLLQDFVDVCERAGLARRGSMNEDRFRAWGIAYDELIPLQEFLTSVSAASSKDANSWVDAIVPQYPLVEKFRDEAVAQYLLILGIEIGLELAEIRK